ncbi:MAG: adenosylcobinamide-GDP ribazoletransferase [Planctomycetota bacterium]
MTPAPLRGLRAAFVFMTRVPLGGFPYRDADWRWASAHFPAVGLVVGAVAAAVHTLLAPYGLTVAAVAAVAASIAVTGAFHEDGLADSADALGGGLEPKERVLEILKDSRLGTYGSTALILSILGRVALIAELGGGEPLDARLGGDALSLSCAAWGLVCAHAVARVAPVLLMAALPYATHDAHSKSRHLLGTTWLQALCASLWGALVLAVAPVPIATVAGLAAALLLVTVWTGRRFVKRVGGITGDFLGALEQFGEPIVLLAFLVGVHGA